MPSSARTSDARATRRSASDPCCAGKGGGAQMWAGTPPRPPPAQAPRGGNAPAVKHSRALVRGRAATPGARLADAECFTSTSSSLQVGQQLLRRWLGRPETSPRGRNDRPARARPSCAALHAPGPPTAGAHRFSLPQHRHRAAHPPFYDAADRPRRGGHVDVPGVAAAAHSLGAARSGTLDTKPARTIWPLLRVFVVWGSPPQC